LLHDEQQLALAEDGSLLFLTLPFTLHLLLLPLPLLLPLLLLADSTAEKLINLYL
jgi:hypothetical protein